MKEISYFSHKNFIFTDNLHKLVKLFENWDCYFLQIETNVTDAKFPIAHLIFCGIGLMEFCLTAHFLR